MPAGCTTTRWELAAWPIGSQVVGRAKTNPKLQSPTRTLLSAGQEEKRKLLWVTAPQYADPMSGRAGIGAAKALLLAV
ncbi:hypothetical protein MGG_16731 [Pyricularia oryzae 70-15]|uniref:Uncharacterized protein n=3 Tax=Pyricularia oryzae TaxID=318829 RepID=G4N4L2_PYRO7|nr:uncharacterized protein MGG_16731 [Pyricularia oryzae 70-15]EHA52027.1 hypothetical protein MGG_16731 [Pyricularia oryzae 70-15]ELQ33178.1 hypothetical protein OOU_Y34scaffold00995g32 [Pyricularia oryzae Y34]